MKLAFAHVKKTSQQTHIWGCYIIKNKYIEKIAKSKIKFTKKNWPQEVKFCHNNNRFQIKLISLTILKAFTFVSCALSYFLEMNHNPCDSTVCGVLLVDMHFTSENTVNLHLRNTCFYVSFHSFYSSRNNSAQVLYNSSMHASQEILISETWIKTSLCFNSSFRVPHFCSKSEKSLLFSSSSCNIDSA